MNHSHWTDDRREIARLQGRLELSRRRVLFLHNLLRVIKDCRDGRCSLCAACLKAACDGVALDLYDRRVSG